MPQLSGMKIAVFPNKSYLLWDCNFILSKSEREIP